MLNSIEPIISELKQARKQKKMSQRELSKKIKIPQSHISKIESGIVDIQLSNAIELARILGLELMLIPKNMVKIIEALMRSEDQSDDIPLYRLENED